MMKRGIGDITGHIFGRLRQLDPPSCVCVLESKDGEDRVIVSGNQPYLQRWKRDLNRAFDRGVKLGLAARGAILEAEGAATPVQRKKDEAG